MHVVLAAMSAISLLAAPPGDVELAAKGPLGPLRGTLSEAGPSAPVILMIPGSGPTDRDGNNPLGVSASTYRLLAQGLAERGVATVRTDKRGLFQSAQAVSDPNAVTIPDYVSDTRNWIAAIRERTGARCVWLLGHSEGGLIAMATAQAASDLCGLILVAAPGRPVGEALREQLRANPANAPVLDQAMAAIKTLEEGKRVDTAGLHPGLMPLFAPQVQGMMISLLSYDPAELLGKYRGPVLILHGERDIQISVEDARRLKTARPDAKLALLPDANHVLKSVPTSDRAANLAAYSDPTLPLAQGVVETIAEFVKGRR